LGCAADPDAYDHAHERGVLAGKSDAPLAQKQWTFILYAAADNDLEPFILSDVNELESVGSTENVNLVALVDGSGGAARYYLEQDDDPFELRSPRFELGQVDSGNADTLDDFVAWAMSSFPARRYAVVISGHGGGNPRVIAPDFRAGSAMSPRDLVSVLDRVRQQTGRRVDVFGADACLMQTVEVAYQLRDSVENIVASQNTEPGDGWPYDAVGGALVSDPMRSGEELATEMAGAFAEDQPQSGDYVIAHLVTDRFLGVPPGATRSLFGHLDELSVLLAAAIERSADAGATVDQAVRATFRARGGGLSGAQQDPYGDLDRFLFGLEGLGSADLRARAAALRADLGPLTPTVIEGLEADARGARGVSIYLPLPEDTAQADIDQYRASCDFCARSAWSDLVSAYALP
jgi:hypothetical protein